MDYNKIEILEKYGPIPAKIRIIMEDGTEEIIEEENQENKTSIINNRCWTKLQEFWLKEQDKYDSTASFINSNPKIVEKLEERSVEETIEELAEEETLDEPVAARVVETKEEKTKEKKNHNGIKITAIVLASMIGIAGVGYTLCNLLDNKNKNKDDKQDEINKNSIITTVDYNDKINNGFNGRVDQIVTNENSLREDLSNMVAENQINNEEMLQALSDQAAISFSNMYEISEFINGKTLRGNVVMPEFYNLFPSADINFSSVMRFNILHNNIIHYAYEEKSVEKTKNAIDEFNKAFIEFVLNGKECVYIDNNNQPDICYFDDLSPMAQNTIIQMGMAVLTIERDFNFNINGINYNRMKSIEEVSALSTEVVQKIMSNQTSK